MHIAGLVRRITEQVDEDQISLEFPDLNGLPDFVDPFQLQSVLPGEQ